jgi:hypothetical protein
MLHGPLLMIGFVASKHDPALFVHTSPCSRTLIFLYVDDMIITGAHWNTQAAILLTATTHI